MLWALMLCKYVHLACVDHNFKYFYRLHATAAKLQCLTKKHFPQSFIFNKPTVKGKQKMEI